jgi:hypothetical protein
MLPDLFPLIKNSTIGELPITLTRSDGNAIQQQKKPGSTIGLISYCARWNLSIDRGVPTTLSIQLVYTPTMERTFVELFHCSIRPDRLTRRSSMMRGNVLEANNFTHRCDQAELTRLLVVQMLKRPPRGKHKEVQWHVAHPSPLRAVKEVCS